MTSSLRLRESEIYGEIVRQKCEESHLYFTRYFFKQRQGIKFRVNWHHMLVAEALQDVLDGKTENLVINVPPGSSKTEMAVINFIARSLALYPHARFLHISSGDDLVMLNSQTARDIVQSDEYQRMWPRLVASDAKATKRWNIMMDDKKAGGVYAVALGGQITGFRAGYMTPGFSGAILIDDPLKADDAFSDAAIRVANRRLLTTVKSRKANPKTPTIVIMQRIGERDPAAFIKGGNLPGEWRFVTIPALIDDAYVAALPQHIRAMVDTSAERDAKGRFSYWPYKEPLADMLELESGIGSDSDGNRVSRFVFNAQYMQAPTAIGGNLIHSDWFVRRPPIDIKWRKIFADTAMKTGERNDFSVFQCWGMAADGKMHLLDQIRGKWEAPELKRRAIEFWNKQKSVTGMGALRQMVVEDKSSGTGLIQDIRKSNSIPILGVETPKDKLTRVMDVLSFIEAGCVVLPDDAPWVSDFIAECESFTADDTHAHDDQIDPMCYAISDMLARKGNHLFS